MIILKPCYSLASFICPSENGSSDLRFGARHLQCFMAFLGVALAYCLRVNISVAIVPMTQKSSASADYPELPWDESMKGTVLSSFFWGYILLQIPGGQLAEKFGPKFMIATALFLSGTITILTPFAAIHGGFYWMVFTRVIQGACQGFCYPSTNFLLAKWAPIPERGRLVTSVFNGDRFGTLVTMAAAGILCNSEWGWPSVFYVSGSVTILYVLVYCHLGANSPEDHKTISKAEKEYILNSIPDTSSERNTMRTPWLAMATSGPLWALLLAHCGQNWGYYTLLTQIPSYMSSVLGCNIQKSGLLSSIPYLSSFIMAFIFAAIGDTMSNNATLSKTASRKLWNSIALWGGSVALCFLAFAGKHEMMAIILLVVATGLNSASLNGYHRNHLDLSPNFSGTLMGITNGFASITSMIAPLLAGFVVTDPKSVVQWQYVFLISAAVFFVGNLIFVIFGTAEVQLWNSPDENRNIPMTDVFNEKIESIDKKRSEGH